jgi:hypothetical protein
MEQLGCHWTDCHELWYLSIFLTCHEKLRFHENLTRITGALHEHLFTCMIISRRIIRRVRNVSAKICREYKNTHFIFSIFFFKSCRLWDNMKTYCTVQSDRPQIAIWRKSIACWIIKVQSHTCNTWYTFILK